jgi:hypothetical protein
MAAQGLQLVQYMQQWSSIDKNAKFYFLSIKDWEALRHVKSRKEMWYSNDSKIREPLLLHSWHCMFSFKCSLVSTQALKTPLIMSAAERTIIRI